jgi:endonuclease/exonuclease/phosphatase family metal-dependent hydrolase
MVFLGLYSAVTRTSIAKVLRRGRLAVAAGCLLASWSCAAGTSVRPLQTVALPSCRAATLPAGEALIEWEDDRVAPDDRQALDRWCRGVGPAVYLPAARSNSIGTIGGISLRAEPKFPRSSRSHFTIAVVSWNVNVGAGDLAALVEDLRSGWLTGGRPVVHFVLLLQEALRGGSAVPPAGEGQAGARRLVRGASPTDIVSFARSAGLSLYYVPSMRNGFDAAQGEDRGNAIVSTLPLTGLRALELPFERQRRVALLATLGGADSPFELTVACAHLDPFVSARRLWVFGAVAARARQARALAAVLPGDAPLVVGGDFNTWAGVDEPAVREILRVAPDASPSTRPTFGNNRVLDFLFFRTPAGWHARYGRADRGYGSDHFPIVGWVEAGAQPADDAGY